MEPQESGSSVGRVETPKIYIGGVRREAHAVGRWSGKTERTLVRRHDCLDTTEVESHVVEADEGLARQCPIPYAQRGASNTTLEAYCKCPAPEACETAVLGRREPAELARTLLHQLEGSRGLRAIETRQLERQGEESLFPGVDQRGVLLSLVCFA